MSRKDRAVSQSNPNRLQLPFNRFKYGDPTTLNLFENIASEAGPIAKVFGQKDDGVPIGDGSIEIAKDFEHGR